MCMALASSGRTKKIWLHIPLHGQSNPVSRYQRVNVLKSKSLGYVQNNREYDIVATLGGHVTSTQIM